MQTSFTLQVFHSEIMKIFPSVIFLLSGTCERLVFGTQEQTNTTSTFNGTFCPCNDDISGFILNMMAAFFAFFKFNRFF